MEIYEFQKNALEKVKIQFLEYGGREIVDVRVFYTDPNGVGNYKPSRKGVSMERKHIEELFEGIKKAYERWKKETNKIKNR